MVGGEAARGAGVPSAGGLLGGLVAVPEFLKGAVELALILSEADFTGFGKKAFKEATEQLLKQTSKEAADTLAVALRTALASEARVEAAKATKKAVTRIATDRRTKDAWKRATKEERAALQRKVYYEHVDKFYREAEAAAKKAKQDAESILRKRPKDANALDQRRAAETMEQATEVKPVAARLPQNHAYAGKQISVDYLPAEYRKQGLRFTKDGYPDFEPHAMELPSGGKYVEIKYSGSRVKDYDLANEAAKLPRIPTDYTWHHVQDGKRMILVPYDLHKAVKHSGGVAQYKHRTGVARYE